MYSHHKCFNLISAGTVFIRHTHKDGPHTKKVKTDDLLADNGE